MLPERLLVVIDGMDVGGSQRQIVHLLTGLDRNRWQPELAYFRNGSFLLDRLRDSGIPVHHVQKRGRFDIRFLVHFARLLRQRDYSLVHAFSLTAELWVVLARFVARRRPLLVASERNQYADKPMWYWMLKRFVVTHSAAVIANSAAGARHTARSSKVPLDRFDTVPNGVEMPQSLTAADVSTLRAAIGAPPGRLFGLFVGRLVPQKNLACLVRALAMLAPEHRPWLALVGNGPLRESVRQLAVSSGVASDIVLPGERDDSSRLMQAADFLVLPSRFEGQSNALLEAMAAGCPVIASAVGGTTELVEHERTGLLFADDDAAALARCMLSFHKEPSLRQHLARQARENMQRRHGTAVMVAATSAIYERSLAAASAPPHPTPPVVAPARSGATPESRRLRVLMLLDGAYPPPQGGGTEIQVRTLARELRRRGHHVTVLTPAAKVGPQQHLGRVDAVPVCRLQYPRIRVIGGLWLMARMALFLWSRRDRYDAWHVHSPRRLGATAVLLGSRLKRPRVVVKVASAIELEQGNLASNPTPQARLAFACLRHADAWQAISQRIAHALTARGIPVERISAIPNAVDLARFHPGPRLHTGHPRFVFVGRLIPVKNLFLLFAAFASVTREHPGAQLQIVGSGPLESALKRHAEQLGIAASVEFSGHRHDIEALLRDADFGVLPSSVEGLSNSLLECMASGLPMIASRVSGSEDLIRPGVNGWLFEPDDVQGLLTCLREAVALSPQRRRQMGEAARVMVERHAGAEQVVGGILSLYYGCNEPARASVRTNDEAAMRASIGLPGREP